MKGFFGDTSEEEEEETKETNAAVISPEEPTDTTVDDLINICEEEYQDASP